MQVAKNAPTNRNLHANLTEGAIRNLDIGVRRMGECQVPAVTEGIPTIACTLDLNGINTTFIAYVSITDLFYALCRAQFPRSDLSDLIAWISGDSLKNEASHTLKFNTSRETYSRHLGGRFNTYRGGAFYTSKHLGEMSS